MINLTQNLRLEIEVPTTGLPNLIQNPSGEKGSWGWVTPLANTNMTTTNSGQRLRFTTTAAQAAYFKSELMPVAASKYVAAQLIFSASSAGYGKISFEFYNSSKTLISTSAQTSLLSPSGAAQYVSAVQAPAGTAYVALRFDMYNSTSGTPAANTWVEFYKAMVTWADTSAGLGSTRTNLITNPSFETDTSGWSPSMLASISRSTAQAYTGTASLALSAVEGGTLYAMHSGVTVSAGLDYTASAYVKSSVARSAHAVIKWYNGTTYLSETTGTTVATSTSAWARFSVTGTAPSGATVAKAVLYAGSTGGQEPHYFDAVLMEQASSAGTYFDGSSTGTGKTYAWSGTANNSSSTETSDSSAYAFSDPITWQNILGPTSEINISRNGLDVGLLTAVLHDAALDPSKAGSIVKPGRRVRVRGWNSVNEYPYVTSDWYSIYEGKITAATTDYERNDTTGKINTIVQINASDNIAVLANQGDNRGVAALNDIAYIMEGKGVPWNIVGGVGGNQVNSATVVSYNENASVLDQIAVTRDSNMAYAFVSKNGILTTLPSPGNYSIVPVFSDYPSDIAYGGPFVGYTDTDVSFSTEECINSVMVNWLRYDVGSGQTSEISYGPYTDPASIAQWGPRSATFTIQGATEDAAAIQTFANNVLAANATPVVKVNSLTTKVTNQYTQNAAVYDLDLFWKVQVRFQGQTYTPRITGIEHNITPDDWTINLSFANAGSVATPTFVPSPPFDGITAGGWRVGIVEMFAGDTPPSGALLCNGGTFSSVTYPKLASIVGDKYGVHSGTTYYLPNFTGKSPRGATPGSTGGSDSVTVGTGNLPPHSHAIDHDHAAFTSGGESGHTHSINHDHPNSTISGQYNTNTSTGGTSNRITDIQNKVGGTGTAFTIDVDLPNFTGSSGASTGHTHNIDVPNFTGSSGNGPGASTPLTVTNPFLGMNFIIWAV